LVNWLDVTLSYETCPEGHVFLGIVGIRILHFLFSDFITSCARWHIKWGGRT
jgi:hypothetical protein